MARRPSAGPRRSGFWRLAVPALAGLVAAGGLVGLAAPPAGAAPRTREGATKIVTYEGVSVRVPRSWPVVELSADPTRCLLWNVDAVYLGIPGADQRCPAVALGRRDAVWLRPAVEAGRSGVSAAAPGLVDVGRAGNLAEAEGMAQAAPPGASPTGISSSGSPSASADPDQAWTARDGGVLITVAYGRRVAVARSVLASVHLSLSPAPSRSGAINLGRRYDTAGRRSDRRPDLRSGPASREDVGRPGETGRPRTGRPAPRRAAGAILAPPGRPGPPVAPAPPAPPGAPAAQGTALVTGEVEQARGFDACTVPSVATMRAWLDSPYRVIGTYLGGVNWACNYGDFTRSWVAAVSAMGWSFIPTYVGLQASCSTIPGAALIDPADAASEGTAAAANAVSLAEQFGYGPSSPIYFDMEGYDSADLTCNQGVLSFLSAWTIGLHRAGYLSGVYSSAGSGIAALAAAYSEPGFTRPDDVWIADWDGAAGTSDPYVPAADWSDFQRLHQFYGGHDETWGGATVNVDDDTIAGPVASASPPAPPGPVPVPGQGPRVVEPGGIGLLPSSVEVAPGADATVALDATGDVPVAGVARWQVSTTDGIGVLPGAGVVPLVTTGGVVAPGRPRPAVELTVTVPAGTAPGRYELPVTASVGGRPVGESFLLVDVADPGQSLATPVPLVLYAATPADLGVAEALAASAALPPGDVVGSFSAAWNDLSAGSDLVLAVGRAADNALQTNPCGWSDPAGEAAGSTPFFFIGNLSQLSPGPDAYENAAGSDLSATAALTNLLVTYALTGLEPNLAQHQLGAALPSSACLGSPDA